MGGVEVQVAADVGVLVDGVSIFGEFYGGETRDVPSGRSSVI